MGQRMADRVSAWAVGVSILPLLVAACGGAGTGVSPTATRSAQTELALLPSATPRVGTATPLPQRATETPFGTQAFASATPRASLTPTPTGAPQRPGPATEVFSLPNDLRPLAPGDFNHLSPLATLRFATGDPQHMALAASPDGRLLAAQTDKGDMYVWDLNEGRLVGFFRTFAGWAASWLTPWLSFSPDGQLLAASWGQSPPTSGVGVWRLDGSKLPFFIADSLAPVQEIIFSADGGRLAVIAQGGRMAVIYDLLLSEEIVSISDIEGEVVRSVDGATLAGLTQQGAWVLPWAEGRKALRIEGSWRSISLSGNGKWFALSDADGQTVVYDVVNSKELRRFPTVPDVLLGIALSPDGRLLAAASRSGERYGPDSLVVWRVADGQQVVSFEAYVSYPQAILRFSPDGRLLALKDGDNDLTVWHLASGASDGLSLWEAEFDDFAFNATVTQVFVEREGVLVASSALFGALEDVFLPQGARLPLLYGERLLATVSQDVIRLWGVSASYLAFPAPQELDVITPTTASKLELVGQMRVQTGTDAAFSPDGRWLVVAHTDGKLTRFDLANRRREGWSGHSDWIYRVVFSPDGRHFATASKDGTLKVWDVATRSAALSLSEDSGEVTAAAFSPDGALLAMAGEDLTIKLRDANTGALLRTLSALKSAIWDLAFSPDGETLASISADARVNLWDVESGALLQVLEAELDPGWRVAFSPAGDWLAAGAWDGGALWWLGASSGNWEQISRLWNSVRDLEFSPDGELLALVGQDYWRTLTLYAVRATLETDISLSEAAHPLTRGVAFSADGKLIATVSDDGALRLWGVWR
ncbi:MAG TPA: WD40 repeat domain-containing protein [Anaerolineales bacterium]|nr:WD40 repeat domain-containing protein [Anaerolineales bacterium]